MLSMMLNMTFMTGSKSHGEHKHKTLNLGTGKHSLSEENYMSCRQQESPGHQQSPAR